MKRVLEIRSAPERHWVGDGFHVQTLLSYDGDAGAASPFLLLDYASPMEFASTTRRRGVGPHPHRGFETVTIALQGSVEHRDSAGHHGTIGRGDVQWMTAASGVVHEEHHGAAFARSGGTFEMVQLWVNLPARHKMSPPRYQDLAAAEIPVVALPHAAGTLRVIAGAFGSARGPAQTFTPLALWDVELMAGATVNLAIPAGHTALILGLRGEVRLEGDAAIVSPSQLAYLSRDGSGIRLATRDGARALVLSGEPIDEPVVGYGPFVMNTREEIARAIDDYQSGALGSL
jgi:quercetin 2,3-dioxygenase